MTIDWAGVAELQLVLAGFALLLAAQQASVWRWEGRGSPARFMVLTAIVTAAVFLTGDAVIRALDGGSHVDELLFARSAALAALAISTLPLAAYVAGRPPPWRLMGVVGLFAGARLVLWPGTDLVYRHELVGGVPSYGPVMAPTGLAMIGLVFGYMCVCVGRGPSDREQVTLTAGLLASLGLAVVSLGAGSPFAAEVLCGYVPFPALLAISAMLWTRQLKAFRTVRRLADKQHALAALGTLALTGDLREVGAAASRVVAEHASTGQPGEEVEEQEFAVAVQAVVTAAAGRARADEELHRRATTDELTGLANRTRLVDVINDRLAQSETPLAVARCDVDRFRAVNEVHGHATGDEVLRELGKRLVAVVHDTDEVGRLGSDEFAVVCSHASTPEEVEALGAGLSAAFARPVITPHVDARVTASIGVVTAGADSRTSTDADTLLRDADTAMYDAKARGGAAIGRFHHGLRSAVVFRADLERRLASAVRSDAIVVHYQPIVSLRDRRVAGFEALARWRDGEEFRSPAQWIPVAESTGLIHEIGESVLQQAVRQLQLWLDEGHDIGVNVNVSPRQLSSRLFAESVRCCLRGGPPPHRLALEVTESLAVDEHAAAVLGDLRASGVHIALDDFGTGYSSLAAVSRLPVDIVKVDRSIVGRVNDRDGHALVSAVLAIAGSLDLRVVAEGVDSAELEQGLERLACEYVQGYRYSRPLDAESAGRLLRDQVVRAAAQA